MLRLEDICAQYGSVKALHNVTLNIPEGKMVAIIGPNGAGKSTIFKVISGIVSPSNGRLSYNGDDMLAMDPADRVFCGIAHVPEGRQVFKSLTVAENIEMGAYCISGRARKKEAIDRAYSLFPPLAERKRQVAGMLSGGQQQMLAIGRALASFPKLLLLDEPSLGLSPTMADDMFEHIERAHAAGGLTVLLVEQRVAESLQACSWAFVLDTGRIVLEGAPDVLLENEQIRKTYLGIAAPKN